MLPLENQHLLLRRSEVAALPFQFPPTFEQRVEDSPALRPWRECFLRYLRTSFLLDALASLPLDGTALFGWEPWVHSTVVLDVGAPHPTSLTPLEPSCPLH